MKRISLVLVIVLAATLTVLAQEKHQPPAKPAAANPQFEMLKKLAGEWNGTAQHMTDAPGESVTVNYRITSAGSVVMETLFPGTDHEMVTMYHMDGNDLVLTHYCSLGNQPHMKAQAGKDPRTLTFTYASGTNMQSPNDMHMHGAEFKFIDDNHFTTRWTMYNEGKSTGESTFDLKRKGT